MPDSLTLSNLLLIDECLLDARRVNFFREAIERIVKPGDIVVDAGTGTGIMALCAARAGAKKVFAVELDSGIAEIAKHNVQANHYDSIIEVINRDAATFMLPTKAPIDVLIMEMLDTGLVAEHEARTMIALKQNGVIDDHTRLLPEKANLLIRAINYDFNFYGFYLPSIVQARNYGVSQKIKGIYSSLESYGIVEFRSLTSSKIAAKVKLEMSQAGIINALELRTDIYLAGKKYSSTTDMNMPVVIPITERGVKEGDVIDFDISYQMGEGFGTLKIT